MVAVHPLTQIVRWMVAWVTAELVAPGVSVRLGSPVRRTLAAGVEANTDPGMARRAAMTMTDATAGLHVFRISIASPIHDRTILIATITESRLQAETTWSSWRSTKTREHR
jgi:hypothetical protein